LISGNYCEGYPQNFHRDSCSSFSESITTLVSLIFFFLLVTITAKEISSLILELQNQYNMTSIVVTHDLLCAKIIADYAIVLNEGHIIHSGRISELVSSKDEFLQNFFNDEVINPNGRD
jgi:ABC-type Na+ transport system ATPase subunit NatA